MLKLMSLLHLHAMTQVFRQIMCFSTVTSTSFLKSADSRFHFLALSGWFLFDFKPISRAFIIRNTWRNAFST